MISDRALGAIIVTVAIIGMIGYTYWLFFTPAEWMFLGRELSWWALAVPMWVAVAILAFIGGWIGYTLITTPPPTLPEEVRPPEERPPEVKVEEEKEEKEAKKPRKKRA